MRPNLKFFIAAAATAVVTGCAPRATVARPREAVIDSVSVYRMLSVMADDSMEGRATASRGGDRAAAYIARMMGRAGLSPVGDSGFLQRVPVRLAAGRQGGAPRPFYVAEWSALDTVPKERRARALNVVGVLRGADPALRDQYILVDAHYDHLGVRANASGDSVFNGADDDASGTVAVLEIARALSSGERPKRSIIFAATTGEEVGLIGTRWYIQHPVVPIAQTVANLEIEMIGRPDSLAGGRGKAWLTGYERSTMGDMLAATGIPIVPDKRPDQQFFTRSDNIAFARLGVPAHTLSSFNLHSQYHTPKDDLSFVDAGHMAEVIRAATRAVRELANGPLPAWKPGGRP